MKVFEPYLYLINTTSRFTENFVVIWKIEKYLLVYLTKFDGTKK
jgi:hypothetical protein